MKTGAAAAAAEWTPFECPGCRKGFPRHEDSKAMIVCRECWPALPEALRDAWLLAADMAANEKAAKAVLRHYGIKPQLVNTRRMYFNAAHLGTDIAELMFASPYRTADPRAWACCLWCGVRDRASAMYRYRDGYYCAWCNETADEDAPPEKDELIAIFGEP